MKSEEMKMIKYETLIRDIDNYLGETGIGKIWIEREVENSEDEYTWIKWSPLEFFFNKSKDNKWIEGVFENTFQDKNIYCNTKFYNLEEDVMSFLHKIRRCNTCTNRYYSKHCNISYHLLFWLIFSLSIDNENYNNNLSVVSDVAFILDFDEEMLGDWIAAVKGVLEGKKLGQIKYETDAAKAFFIR